MTETLKCTIRRCCGDQKRFSVQLTNHTRQPKDIVLLRAFVHRSSFIVLRPRRSPAHGRPPRLRPSRPAAHHAPDEHDRRSRIGADNLLFAQRQYGLSSNTNNIQDVFSKFGPSDTRGLSPPWEPSAPSPTSFSRRSCARRRRHGPPPSSPADTRRPPQRRPFSVARRRARRLW